MAQKGSVTRFVAVCIAIVLSATVDNCHKLALRLAITWMREKTTSAGTKVACFSRDEIRKLRNRLGLTQAGLAEILCVERNTVARYEMKKNIVPPRPVQFILSLLAKEADGL